MDYNNEFLIKIHKGQVKHNLRYGKYYWRYSKEKYKEGLPVISERIKKRGERIFLCATIWQWDKYELNKLMDLQKLNRCENHRFCPFCKVIALAKARHKLKPHHNALVSKGYDPYLLTLTVPNVEGDKLDSTVDKLYKDSRRLFRGFREDSQNSFKFREFKIVAAVRVLEITYNSKTKTYHPHLHCIIYTKPLSANYIEKKYKGAWSNKQKDYLKYSQADIHIKLIWKMINDKKRMSKKNYQDFFINCIPDLDYNKFLWNEVYQCDLRPLDENGFNEVMKYTFKDNDIPNYKVFKTIMECLEHRRIRQTFGDLMNVELEDIEDGEVLDIEDFLEKKECPQPLLVKDIKLLYTEYSEYRKISRFNRNLNKEINSIIKEGD